MSDAWLEVSDENINVEEIMRRIRERVTSHDAVPSAEEPEESPLAVAEALWKEMIGDAFEESTFSRLVSVRQRDCDIVPRYYVIDWRIPILGPIHAVVRRIINAEIRRYLLPSLDKQSSFNRKMLRALKGLAEENARLRQEIEALRGAQESEIG